MNTHHICPSPLRHRLGIAAVMALWLAGPVACVGIPILRSSWHHTAPWSFFAALCGTVVSTTIVLTLARWHCQPPIPARRRYGPLAWLVLIAVLAREQR